MSLTNNAIAELDSLPYPAVDRWRDSPRVGVTTPSIVHHGLRITISIRRVEPPRSGARRVFAIAENAQ
jgi:hypothetical protein